MKKSKKLLCALLPLVLILGLCACNGNAPKTPDEPETLTPPDVIFGSWYPMPDVSDVPVEIYEDGTCVAGGQQWNWEAKSVEEDKVVLIAGEGEEEFEIEFKYLKTGVPVLAEKYSGWSVQNPELWNYTTEWYNEETGDAFTLTLFEMQENGCKIDLQSGMMTVEVPDGPYILEFTAGQCVVITPAGTSIVYVPIDGGMGGFPGSGDDGGAEAKYVQARQDLEQVLTQGYMYVEDGNVSKRVHGSEAIEKLYHTFVSLQNYVDVSQELMCIQKVDNVLVKRNSLYPGSVITKTYRYDAFGGIERIYEDEAVTSGNYLCCGYAAEGKVNALTVCGVVSGVPVMDENGKIQTLKVTSTSGKEYTAIVTCDVAGNVVRVDVPFGEGRGEIEAQCRDVYEFLYDGNGKLIQYTLSRYGKFGEPSFYNEHGYYEKHVTEYYYDAADRVTKAITHESYTDGPGGIGWDCDTTNFSYNTAGQLSKVSMGHSVVLSETDADTSWAYQAIFNNTGFVDSVGKDLFGTSAPYLETPSQLLDMEYEYGSIYIFKAEE